ncbi:hypothetical protein KO494_11470 [Lacinutrix sp. C3R15]|uniref:hypothetical protein n=1 Tax=Flavobacteriaceae TaxID=49546 RepID=UPI001C0860D0|nr:MULTISPECIES: hypothetical protein [Flavobacteriaceae]MBU2940155.1 hypothetical protein [Lacinutrix sp. C3R15]MDO6623472.1 hypothetical protein [Oceanihabitans sp. 1_MG-2023]
MLDFFRYNKSKRNIIEFFKIDNSDLALVEKPRGVINIKFSSITKNGLLEISNKLINTFRSDIVDLEVVFCENFEMSINNGILISIKNKFTVNSNLVLKDTNYKYFNEYHISRKFSNIFRDKEGNTVYASEIGIYNIFKMKKIITQKEIENAVIPAFTNLDVKYLNSLDDNTMYSNLSKKELIEEFTRVFKDYKSKKINKLTYKKSKCNFCFPLANAFEFYNSENNKFIVRYIIHSDTNGCIVRLCNNKPSSNDSTEIPF